MCCEIYSLKVNAKPETIDKNRFIIDVDRGLHPSLLPTELSLKTGVLHPFVSFPMVYFKYFEIVLKKSIISIDYRDSSDFG